MVVCRTTKEVRFIPYKEKSIEEDLAYAFFQFMVSTQGLPEEIISDKDKLFTSKFWKAFMEQLGVNHNLLTAFYPQTDGQSERMNQVIEQCLSAFANYEQYSWLPLLPLAQFT